MKMELNSHGVNKAIKATILSEEKMKEIGFTDYSKTSWYFCRKIKLLNCGLDISFNVSIPKDGSDISIDVLDEDFCQPYDYQHILSQNKNNQIAKITKEQVEKWMNYLQENGILTGHVYGEYI